jgi:hypothetical protein
MHENDYKIYYQIKFVYTFANVYYKLSKIILYYII